MKISGDAALRVRPLVFFFPIFLSAPPGRGKKPRAARPPERGALAARPRPGAAGRRQLDCPAAFPAQGSAAGGSTPYFPGQALAADALAASSPPAAAAEKARKSPVRFCLTRHLWKRFFHLSGRHSHGIEIFICFSQFRGRYLAFIWQLVPLKIDSIETIISIAFQH